MPSSTGRAFFVLRRPLRGALALALAVGGAGCKDGGERSAPDSSALRAQQALIEKREAFLATRKRLHEQRSQLQDEIRKVTDDGGDTTELERKLAATNSLIEQQNDQLADEFSALSAKLDALAAASGQRDESSIKDADLRSRERLVTQREDRVNQRELALIERERRALERERQTCGPAPAVIVQAPAASKGGTYTRKEIDPLLARARAAMGKRGILPGDLPAHAQGLEREATRALADSDLGKAYLAASQLAATVDAVKIDRAFVKAKIDRLNRLVAAKGSGIGGELNQRLGSGIAEVMQRWGDGDFAQANSKLNQLYALL